MNELFVETEMLCLSVDDMIDLGDVCVDSLRSPQPSAFRILRVFVVSKCAKLSYLFTIGVAEDLLNLEHLEVVSCNNMEQLICTENAGKETIMFPKLQFLSLCDLPKLLGLCHNVNTIELPQLVQLNLKGIPGFTCIYPQKKLETSSLLKEEVMIPKLETLQIDDMENLNEIWPSELGSCEKVKLREIEVKNCDKLVNLFPDNPMSLLHHLEELVVEKCGSIESLFNINLDCIGAIGEEDNSSSLKNIKVENSGKLRDVWRIKGTNSSRPLVRGFQAVEKINIKKCERFRNVFTPITVIFDLGALLEILIQECGENRGNDDSEESCQEQEQEQTEEETLQEVTDTKISNVVFPSYLIHSFHDLNKLELFNYEGVEVVFEIESRTSRDLVSTHHNQQQPVILPNLQELHLVSMDNMSHVWKCSNWNKFLTLPKQQAESPFHNLTTIRVERCKSIKYLFSPLMAKLLSNLKKVEIYFCDGIDEVVSNMDDEDEENTTFTSKSTHTSTPLFPSLDSLTLYVLKNLKCIGGGGAKHGSNEISFNNTITTTDQFELSDAGGVSWSLCQYAREIEIYMCDVLSCGIPCYAAGQMQKLQVLTVSFCDGMKEVFENSGCDEGITRVNHSVYMLPNLKILKIYKCGGLEHIFTFSALKSLRQLQELKISYCKALKVIVKKEEKDALFNLPSKEVVVFPRLKSIELEDLPELVGFFLGKNEFHLPSLDKLIITKCPKMMVFAAGGSTAPHLKYMHTELGKHTLDQESDLNFHQIPFPRLHSATLCPATSEGILLSFHNLINLHVVCNNVKKIIPSSQLLQLQKLETISVISCYKVEEVFEEALEVEGRNRNRNSSSESESGSGFDESSQTTTTTLVNLPNLTQVCLYDVQSLRYIWKSNQWSAFEFPNLTRLSINSCDRLEHVFSSSMVGSLLQLQELHISYCKRMEEVIVKDADVSVEEDKEKEYDGKTNEILVLPRLKSISLSNLACLKGFSMGKEDFSFPLLDTLIINQCPAITTFTKGNSATPQLKEIETSLGPCYAAGEKDINSAIIKDQTRG